MKALRWFVFIILYFALLAYAASAQTVTPVVSEFNKAHAKGTVTTTNDAIVSQVVTVRPYSMDAAGFHELDSTVHVKLSETSAKVPPRSTHLFDFDIVCDKSPCVVAFINTFTGQHVTDSIKLEIKIPSTAYVCTDRKKDCRKYVREQLWHK